MRKLTKDNRGAGLVSVLICVFLIMAFGATLMYTSYIGLLMRGSERKSTTNFYKADAVMDEIRSGLQELVTEAISQAYTEVLVTYNSSSATEDSFHAAFKDALFSSRIGADSFFTVDAVAHTVTYNPMLIIELVNLPLGATVTEEDEDEDGVSERVTASFGGAVIVIARADSSVTVTDDDIVLNRLTLRYTEDGYETDISTDIRILLPDFEYSVSSYALSGIAEYALIAADGISSVIGDAVEIDGSAYAGGIVMTDAGNSLTVKNGTLVSGGPLSVANAAKFTTEPTVEFWCEDIVLTGTGPSASLVSEISLSGSSYVSDDLELNGTGAKATLSGRYYGFGSDKTDSSKSSSVIVNSRNTVLNMSGLTSLMLAGHSFINANPASHADDIVMGQSVSVKTDQLAYLVPVSFLTVNDPDIGALSNPYFYSADADSLTGKVSLSNKTLWSVGGATRNFAYYHATLKIINGSLASDPGMKYSYCYVQFNDGGGRDARQWANEYFRDYFNSHHDDVESYLRIYSDELSATVNTITSGYAYNLTDDDLSILREFFATAGSSSARLLTMYQNLCRTLTTGNSAVFASPYEYIVNRNEVAKLGVGITYFADAEGTARAAVYRGGGTVSLSSICDGHDDVSIVLVQGANVTVDQSFTGILICDGAIAITNNSKLNAHSDNVTVALQAATTLDGEPRSLISFLNIGSESRSSSVSDVSSWDMDTMVTYSEWKKN